jgi:hypothetical protein
MVSGAATAVRAVMRSVGRRWSCIVGGLMVGGLVACWVGGLLVDGFVGLVVRMNE